MNDVLELVEPIIATTEGRQFALRSHTLKVLGDAVSRTLADFHASNPELPGMPLERLRLGLEVRLTKPAFDAAISILVKSDLLATIASAVHLPSHTSSMRIADQKLWDRISQVMDKRRIQPPPLHELAEELNQSISDVRKVCKTMVRMGMLIEVRKDRYFLKSNLVELAKLARDIANVSPCNAFTAAQFRDSAGCGRATAI